MRRAKVEAQIMREAARLLENYASSIRSEYEGTESFQPGGSQRVEYERARVYAEALRTRPGVSGL